MLQDTGIKTKIIKQYLPIMNQLINKYLASMEFYVNFTLDENFDETIKSRFRDNFNYASFSEGEKMRIDLALLFTWRAIAKMKNSTNTNLLILDEIFDSSLDSVGTDEFLKILNTLEGENVFVISHKQDVLVDKFKHTLKFEKNKNFSKMVVTNTKHLIHRSLDIGKTFYNNTVNNISLLMVYTLMYGLCFRLIFTVVGITRSYLWSKYVFKYGESK